MVEGHEEQFKYTGNAFSIHLTIGLVESPVGCEDDYKKLMLCNADGDDVCLRDDDISEAVYIMKRFVDEHGHLFPGPKRELID